VPRAPRARAAAENSSPQQAARADPPAATQDDFSGPDVVQRADLAGVGLGGDPVDLGDQERVGETCDHLTAPERPDGRVKGMVTVPEVVEDVRYDRGVQPARRQVR